MENLNTTTKCKRNYEGLKMSPIIESLNDSYSKEIKTKDKFIFFCSFCSKVFLSKNSLLLHQRIIHPTDININKEWSQLEFNPSRRDNGWQ